MSTYQDRATKILLAFGEYYHLQELNKFGVYDMAKEFPDELSLKQALSELASIVSEEKQTAKNEFAEWLAEIIKVSKKINGKDATIRLETLETLLLDYSQQRDQLSNRSKGDE